MLGGTWTAIWSVLGSEHGTELPSKDPSKNGITNTLQNVDATALYFGGHEGNDQEQHRSEVSDQKNEMFEDVVTYGVDKNVTPKVCFCKSRKTRWQRIHGIF